MAGRKEVQKSITFRLNLDREDERELYETIRQHNRHVPEDVYASAGAYIKAALRYYQRKENSARLQEQFQADMEEYLQRLAVSEREEFLKALDEHDKRLVSMILEAVMPMAEKVSATIPVLGETGIDGMTKRVSWQETAFSGRESGMADDSGRTFPNREESAETDNMPEEALSYVLGL